MTSPSTNLLHSLADRFKRAVQAVSDGVDTVQKAHGAIQNVGKAIIEKGPVTYVQDKLTEDNSAKIDPFLSLLDPLLELNTSWRVKHSSLSTEETSLEAMISPLQLLLENSETIFGRALRQKEQQPFQELHQALSNLVKDSTSEYLILDEALQKKVDVVLAKLKQLKKASIGILPAAKLDVDPRITTFTHHLDAIRLALEERNPDKCIELFTTLKGFMNDLRPRRKSTFYDPPLQEVDIQTINDFMDAFHAFMELPLPLRADERFHPNFKYLTQAVHTTACFLQKHTSSQRGSVAVLLEKIKDQTKELLKRPQQPYIPAQNPRLDFDKLEAAISFFYTAGGHYQDKDKKRLLLVLIQECDIISQGFENDLLTTIANTSPDGAINIDWAKEHLLDSKAVLLKAFRDAKDKVDLTALPAPQTPQQQEKVSSLPYIIQSALASISVLPIAFIEILTGSLERFFTGQTFTKWMEKQPNKELLQQIKEATYAAIQVAKQSKTIEDYKKVFTTFQELYNKHHFVFEGLELPALFGELPTEDPLKIDENLADLQRQFQNAKTQEPIEFDWSNDAAADAKVNMQSQELSANLRDQLTYQFVYNKLLGAGDEKNRLFNKIKTTQSLPQNISKKERSTIFIRELKAAIDGLPQRNRFTKWCLKLALPYLHKIFGYYTNNFVSTFLYNFNNAIERLDKKDLIIRANNCLSHYNAMLKEWGLLPQGGDKHPVIQKLMKQSKHLEYGDQSYRQDQLYKKVSDTFINRYFNLFHDTNDNPTTLSGKLHKFTTSIHRLVWKKKIHSNNIILRTVNGLFSLTKLALLGIPSYFTFVILYPIFKGTEFAGNALTKSILRQVLYHSKTVDAIIDSTRKDIYENNPYVHAITSFLATQLEALSKQLDQDNNDLIDNDESSHLADTSRNRLRTLFENLFEVLKSNQPNTQEKLQELLKSKGILGSAQDQLDQWILPKVTESFIDMIAVASDKVLTKKTLRQPISLLLTQLNTIITQVDEEKTTQDVQSEKIMQQLAEEKLKKYTDRILRQLIRYTVTSSLNDLGKSQDVLVTKFQKWLSSTLLGANNAENPGLLYKWQLSLETLQQQDTPTESRFKTIEGLQKSINNFIIEFDNQRDKLNDLPPRTFGEIESQIKSIIRPLMEIANDTKGILKAYQHQKNIYTTEQDQPYLTAVQRAYNTMNAAMTTLSRQDDNSLPKDADIELFRQHSKFLTQFFSQFTNHTLRFEKDKSIYTELDSLLQEYPHQDVLVMETRLYSSLLPMMKTLHQLRSDLDSLKKEHLDESKRWRHRYTIYHKFKQSIDALPIEVSKKQLVAALAQVHKAKNPQALDTAINHLQNTLNQTFAIQNQQFREFFVRIGHLHRPIEQKIHQLNETFTRESQASANELAELLPAITASLTALQHSVTAHIQPISFNYLTSDRAKSVLTTLPEKIIYRDLKPKATEAVKLVRDGNFAQFLVNHIVLMPFVSK